MKSKNKYRLPSDTYDRRHDRTVSKEHIHKMLVGEENKEIIEEGSYKEIYGIEANAERRSEK